MIVTLDLDGTLMPAQNDYDTTRDYVRSYDDTRERYELLDEHVADALQGMV